MRMWHRFKILAPLLLAVTTASVGSAQDMSGFGSYGAPAFMPGAPPNYSATSFQGMPQSFQSHPAISPFDNAFEQHFSSDGLWFKRAIGGLEQMNDYHLNVDFISTRTRKMRGVVGDPGVPTFDEDQIRNNAQNLRDTSGEFPDALFLPTFPHLSVGAIPENKNSGIRLSGGVENRMGWKFSWNASYNGSSTDIFDSRANLERMRLHFFDALVLEASGGIANGNVVAGLRHLDERRFLEQNVLGIGVFDATETFPSTVFGSTDEILDRTLYPHGSIGIRTMEPDDVDGTSQLFDLDFIMKHSVQSYGGGAHISFMPLYEKDKLKVRAILGGRVFRLHEGFHFFGADSGLAYTVNQPNGLDDDDDFVVDNVEEDGTLTFTDPIDDDPSTETIVRSFVNSTVRSTMSGPEIGVEYEISERKSFNLYGSTRFGALVNVERMSLQGDNIGNTLAIEPDGSARSQMFDTTTTGVDRTQNYFSDANNSTHISPMFEQSLNAELPIFSKIPVLQDMWQLQHARLRLGWTFTAIGEVTDPNQSINWESNPRDGIFPFLTPRRHSFHQNQFNAGINWEY